MNRIFIRFLLEAIARFYLKKPEVAELMMIKYPSFNAMWVGLLNELCFLSGSRYSYKLTSVNIEITNRCNLPCSICPVPFVMKREKQDMPESIFKKIIDENRDLNFILPFQWGEPLLHQKFFEMVKYAKDAGISVMATSNATLLDEKMAGRMLDSQIDRITFSVDGDRESFEKIRKVSYEKVRDNIKRFKKMRDETGSSVKIDITMVVCEATLDKYDTYIEEWKNFADRVQVIPVFKKGNRGKRCRELYRGSLVVLSNGKVVVCCADYDGILEAGDVNSSSLKKIFNNKRMQNLRIAHAKKKFPMLCGSCDELESKLVSKRFS